MVTLASGIRWDVIRSLQTTRNHYSPGSNIFEECDKAISLALNPRRKVNSYLLRNVMRDARRSLVRMEREIPFSMFSRNDQDETYSYCGYGENSLTARKASPEEILILKDLLATIRMTVSKIRYGEPCLNGLLNGDTVQEISKRIGISRHQVEYAKHKIRCIAAEIFEGGIA